MKHKYNYSEYANQFDSQVKKLINNFLNHYYELLVYKGINISESIIHLLNRLCNYEKKIYFKTHSEKYSILDIYEKVQQCFEWFNKYIEISNESCSNDNKKEEDNLWCNELSIYENSVLVYVSDKKELINIYSLNFHSIFPILILSEFEFPEHIIFPKNFVIVKFEPDFINIKEKTFLSQNFPFIYSYCKVFYDIITVVKPSYSYNLSSNRILSTIFKIISESFFNRNFQN